MFDSRNHVAQCSDDCIVEIRQLEMHSIYSVNQSNPQQLYIQCKNKYDALQSRQLPSIR